MGTLPTSLRSQVGFPSWSRGPLIHRGGEAETLPFGRPRGFQPRGRYKWIKFKGSTRKGNADGPHSFLAMNYEISKVATG